MKVEPTGVIFSDICSIQTDRCVARQPASITSVWTLPGRVQVNVCRPCLEEQVRSGEWEIEGAKVKKRADVAVYSPDKKLQLIVEVKKKPQRQIEFREWAQRIHRNLLAHSGVPSTPFFLLALPDRLYLWTNNSSLNLDRSPDYEIQTTDILRSYFDRFSTTPDTASERQLESLVSSWLTDLVQSAPSPNSYLKWFYDSGLYEATRQGSVITESPIAA